MHIVYITYEYPKKGLDAGGIGSFVQFLGRHLVSNGIRVSIVGINNCTTNESNNDNGVQVYRLGKSTWKFAKFHDNTRRVLKKINEINNINKIDVVEGSELNFAFFPKITTYKKVIRLHGGHHFFAIELNKKPAFWRGFQEKMSFKKADEFIAVSNYVGLQTQKHLKFNFNYDVIFNSINVINFKHNKALTAKKNKILFIGTLCDKKGIKNLILALEIVRKKIPNASLEIIGRDWFSKEGKSYKRYLEEVIKQKKLEDAVCFLDVIKYSSLPNYIQQSQICAFPSKMESFGLVVIEAMSMSKPIVLSDIGPFKEIITNKESGLFFNVNLIRDISNKIIKVLQDDQYAKMLGINAKKKFDSKFHPNILIQKNINFYKALLGPFNKKS
jgi:glycosyltransferase involved in cell wall biosynthesis